MFSYLIYFPWFSLVDLDPYFDLCINSLPDLIFCFDLLINSMIRNNSRTIN